jgi:alkylation response protein AidB-like acyl-CoA dehydrogenase
VLGSSNERLNLAQRNYKVPLKEMDFLINDVHDFQSHYGKLENSTGAESADKEMVKAILETMAQFAEETLAPLNETADREGCTYISESEIKTPTGYKEAYDTFTEGCWQGISFPEEYGGQGMPASLGLFTSEMTATADFAWTMFPGLSKGAINTIMFNATEQLKDKYLHQLVSGEWTGTMCLTEPQCGSDLAQVKTKAIPNGDGSYKITGTKIFISCGDHDLTNNIIHCVLARMPDAPEGTRGISLFLVPKRKVADDGTCGDLNGCNIGRIEDKVMRIMLLDDCDEVCMRV